MSSEPSSSRWLGRKLEGYLLTARVVTGMKAARAQLRLLCRTWEPIASMRRENSKWRTHEEPSTDAKRRDGRIANGPTIQRRRKDQPQELLDIARRCDQRLNRKFFRMTSRGKRSVVAAVAVARELIGFIWAIGQVVHP